MDNKLQEFINLTAAILDIDDYEIRVDQENQLDKTTKAGYVFGTNTILINKTLTNPLTTDKYIEVFMVIAHEMRHMWQSLYHFETYYADGYITENDNEAAYERQLSEVDANAFAWLMIEFYFGKHPAKGTCNIHSYDLIKERAFEIFDDFYSRIDSIFPQDTMNSSDS